MKRFALTISMIFLAGCVTTLPKEEVEAYLSKSGYFNRVAKGPGNNAIEPRCAKATIKKVRSNLGYLDLIVEIDGKEFQVSTINGQFIKPSDSKPIRIELLDKYFTEVPPKLSTKKVKLASGTETAKNLLCKGNFWTGMSKDEFLFVKGLPNRNNRTVSAGLVHEQWVYEGASLDQNTYYYFSNDILTSWQD